MMRLALSPAAVGLWRALIARAAAPRERLLLCDWRSTDWQSLTFAGERHEILLRIAGADSLEVAQRLLEGIADAEFAIPGQIVADINVASPPRVAPDGSTELGIEALTIEE